MKESPCTAWGFCLLLCSAFFPAGKFFFRHNMRKGNAGDIWKNALNFLGFSGKSYGLGKALNIGYAAVAVQANCPVGTGFYRKTKGGKFLGGFFRRNIFRKDPDFFVVFEKLREIHKKCSFYKFLPKKVRKKRSSIVTDGASFSTTKT